jgi:hypothetical protein
MIHSIKVTNRNNESLTLSLTRPDLSGLNVISIEGLGPGKSNINIRESTASSGGVFNSAKTPPKNIVLTLGLRRNSTIEETRRITYRYFPMETQVRLDITTDAGTFYIYGYIESNEATIFSSDQRTVISILCPDPAFLTEDGTVGDPSFDLISLFSFPAGGHAFTSEGESLSERIYTTELVIPFPGSISVGPRLKIAVFGGSVSNPTIRFYNPNTGLGVEYLRFDFTDTLPELEDGDHLDIICEKQNKSITRYVSNTDNNIGPSAAQTNVNYIGALTPDSSWPMLSPGDNLFSYEAETGGGYIRFSYEYTLKYSGI